MESDEREALSQLRLQQEQVREWEKDAVVLLVTESETARPPLGTQRHGKESAFATELRNDFLGP